MTARTPSGLESDNSSRASLRPTPKIADTGAEPAGAFTPVETAKRWRKFLDLIDPSRPLAYSVAMADFRADMDAAIARWETGPAPASPGDEPEQKLLRERLTRIMNWFDDRLRADFPNASIRSAEASVIEDAILALEHVPWKLSAEQGAAFVKALGREAARPADV